MMVELSKFYSDDERRRAEVEYTGNGFLVNFYLDEKLIQKRTTHSEDDAEMIAEDFVLGQSGPSFLSE
jgi:hypothetical protein